MVPSYPNVAAIPGSVLTAEMARYCSVDAARVGASRYSPAATHTSCGGIVEERGTGPVRVENKARSISIVKLTCTM
jgi:hypothetical protein